jgi:oligogalacturonide transport system permease protein
VLLVAPTVAFTVLSTPLVAYGFARFSFPGHKLLFGLMLSTLMLPNTVLVVPRYLIFRNLGWLDSYLPFWVPALLATAPFYTFLIYQFVRGIPREMDESAMIDGLGPAGIYFRIVLPLVKPAAISSAVLMFIWSWNDFFNALIYIPTVNKFPVSLGLRMMIDAEAASSWNQIIAMSIVSMLPCAFFFFICQRYLVEGIATSGIKG